MSRREIKNQGEERGGVKREIVSDTERDRDVKEREASAACVLHAASSSGILFAKCS
jgi:hypothetical protein